MFIPTLRSFGALLVEGNLTAINISLLTERRQEALLLNHFRSLNSILLIRVPARNSIGMHSYAAATATSVLRCASCRRKTSRARSAICGVSKGLATTQST